MPDRLGVMALEDVLGGAVPVVHAVAEAVFPLLAVGAAARFRPLAVAEGLEAVLPDRLKVVLVDVSLREPVPVDVGAGADAAVDEDGGDVHAGVAEIPHGPDLLLIST